MYVLRILKLMYKAEGILPIYIKKVKVKPLSIKSVTFLSAKKGSMQLGRGFCKSRTE